MEMLGPEYDALEESARVVALLEGANAAMLHVDTDIKLQASIASDSTSGAW
jgi:hypothetical protein